MSDGDHKAEGGAPGVSRKVLILAVLVTALVAGIVGAAVGWKVEQQRVKDDLALIRPIGTVVSVDEGSITVDLQTTDEDRTYQVGEGTKVDSPDGGDLSSIVEGTVVLVRGRQGDDGTEAAQIIVLPESAARRR